jgi:hypothetical protein
MSVSVDSEKMDRVEGTYGKGNGKLINIAESTVERHNFTSFNDSTKQLLDL